GLLAACTGMRPGYETPTVNVKSFRAVPSGTGAGLPSFEIDLQVTNPNLEPLKLAGVSYSISLNDQKIIDGVGNDLPVIAGYGQGVFTVSAGVNLLAGVRLFRSLTSNADGMFDYAFEAKLDPGSLRPKIRVRDSGSISLGSASPN
ncbi:MAG: LEA type 2 family protein, partial [Woeseia sp.]